MMKFSDVQEVNDVSTDYSLSAWSGPVSNHPLLEDYLKTLDAAARQDFDASDPKQSEEFLRWVSHKQNLDAWIDGYNQAFDDANVPAALLPMTTSQYHPFSL